MRYIDLSRKSCHKNILCYFLNLFHTVNIILALIFISNLYRSCWFQIAIAFLEKYAIVK